LSIDFLFIVLNSNPLYTEHMEYFLEHVILSSSDPNV